MTTVTKADKITSETFIRVRDLAYKVTGHEAELAAAIRKAGKTDDRTRRAFYVGHIAARTGILAAASERDDAFAAAELTCDKRVYKDPAMTGLDPAIAKDLRRQMRTNVRRNKTEERAYAAARAAWSRFCREHNLVQASAKAGNKNAAKKPGAQTGAKASKAGKPAPRVVPTIANKVELAAFIRSVAAQLKQVRKESAKACMSDHVLRAALEEATRVLDAAITDEQ